MSIIYYFPLFYFYFQSRDTFPYSCFFKVITVLTNIKSHNGKLHSYVCNKTYFSDFNLYCYLCLCLSVYKNTAENILNVYIIHNGGYSFV